MSAVGFGEKPVCPSVLCEGFGMLRTLIEDAKNAGHDVTTVLNSRIFELHPPLEADHEICVDSPVEAENAVRQATEISDAAYITAPETNGTLQRLVEKLERSSTESLNSATNAIAQVSDKLLLQRHARKIGLSTPETIAFNVEDEAEEIARTISERIGFPAVLKPVDGVGCEALSIVNNEKQVEAAIAKTAKRANSRFIAQQLANGASASVALISDGNEAEPIALNKQNITLNTPSRDSTYNGGTTPLNHKQESAAFAAARKLVESVEGLRGYIGVDFVLTENEPVVIEVNPRLTTSYVAIRKVIKTNLAQAIIDATLKHALPHSQKAKGYAHFEKVKTANPTITTLQKTFGMPELVSPPFPNPDGNHTYALVCAQGPTIRRAKHEFNKAKKHLLSIVLSGGKHER
jgi:predicted ATP-grasp superfamily ATP-dependent carboligase